MAVEVNSSSFIRNPTGNADERQGVKQGVVAVYGNVPYYPRPVLFGEPWEIFKEEYLAYSTSIAYKDFGDLATVTLAELFIKNVQEERAEHGRRKQENLGARDTTTSIEVHARFENPAIEHSLYRSNRGPLCSHSTPDGLPVCHLTILPPHTPAAHPAGLHYLVAPTAVPRIVPQMADIQYRNTHPFPHACAS